MSGTAPNGSSKGVSKPDKGGKKGDDKIIVKVAGVVVVTGIAWSLYKTFSRSDHPLANTERGIKKDAANAVDSTKVNCYLDLRETSSIAQVLIQRVSCLSCAHSQEVLPASWI